MSPEVEILMCRERDKENRRNTNRKNSNQQRQQGLISPIAPARRFYRKDQGLNNDSDNNTKIGASKRRSGKGTIQVGLQFNTLVLPDEARLRITLDNHASITIRNPM